MGLPKNWFSYWNTIIENNYFSIYMKKKFHWGQSTPIRQILGAGTSYWIPTKLLIFFPDIELHLHKRNQIQKDGELFEQEDYVLTEQDFKCQEKI